MLAPGTLLNGGTYRVERKLGAGGFGVVYLATEVALQRPVAIKTLRPDLSLQEPALAEAFLGEARLTARLSHTHIVPIYFVGEEPQPAGSVRYLVMEYLGGGDLETALGRRAPPLPQALHWMRQLAEGLAYAHRQGIIHRDLKLRNALLTTEQDLKIADFGLAKAMGAQTKTILRATGTPGYLSPEQIQGRSADARSDLYALGVMYYQLCTGRLPYDAPDIADTTGRLLAITYQHVHAPIPSARAANPETPAAVDALIHRLLAKTPEARPASATEVAQALAALPRAAGEPAIPVTDRDLPVEGVTTQPRRGAVPPTDREVPAGFPTSQPIPTPSAVSLPLTQPAVRPDRRRWPWLAVPALLLALGGGAFAVKAYRDAEPRRAAEAQRQAEEQRKAAAARQAEEERQARLREETERRGAAERQRAEEAARKTEEEARQRAEAERKRAEAEQRRQEEARQRAAAGRQAAGPVAKVEPARPAAEAKQPTATVVPRQEFGSLAIRAKVPGVEVWLGDRRLGEARPGADLLVSNVPVGGHRVTAKKEGYKAWEREVEVAADTKSEVVINLDPLGPPPTRKGDDGAEMVLVPAGEFWMGSTREEVDRAIEVCKKGGNLEGTCKGWFDRELPRHRVFLDAFYIDRYEVTNALFGRFVRAQGYRTTAEREGFGKAWRAKDGKWQSLRTDGATWQTPTGPGSAAQPTYPVVQVSWYDADAYCRWAGKRLPTEAEWEKAARGTDGRRYPWGNAWDPAKANGNMTVKATTPVGAYPAGASPYGVHDMAGNVGEWVQDWYGPYGSDAVRNPTGPSSGERSVGRVGSWNYGAWYLRSAARYVMEPVARYDYVGFRCAQAAETRRLPEEEQRRAEAAQRKAEEERRARLREEENRRRSEPPPVIKGNDGAEMVLIPAGEFWMGSTQAELDRVTEECKKPGGAEGTCKEPFQAELPRHRVTLDAFYIDRHEVTNALFGRFVRAQGYRTTAERTGYGTVWRAKDRKWQFVKTDGAAWQSPGGPGSMAEPTHPVLQVSWHDAQAYCRWRAKRLPTEAEWEKAARGTEGQRYPWGEPWYPTRANGAMRVKTTTPVGAYPAGASPYGVHDMAGNVWEWVSSLYKTYPYVATDGREDLSSSEGRVIRGGSWRDFHGDLRSANRSSTVPANRYNYVGFRCAQGVR